MVERGCRDVYNSRPSNEKIQNEECRRRRSSRLKKDLGPVHNMCAKVMNMMHRSTRAKEVQGEQWNIQVAKMC
jgi:hypothetical protein